MHRLPIIAAIAGITVACSNDRRRDFEVQSSVAERFPRLTHAQWEATVQDLFRLAEPPGLSAAFQPDPQLGRFDNNVLRLSVTGGLWRDYQRAAEALAERVVTDPALLATVIGDSAALDAIDAREVVTSFGLRAFRRPLTASEADRYAAQFAGAASMFPAHAPAVAGVRLTIQNMLQSPFFIYRGELSATPDQRGIPLDDFEVASRLSYLFWNSMPDDELFAAARAGRLKTTDGVREQASRMLEHPRTRDQLRRLHYQAFGISEYGDLDKDTQVFPTWKRELGRMMQEEVLRFIDSVIASDGGIGDLLTSTRAFVNADLARLYGVPGEFGSDYVEVELDPETRAGLLTRAGFLAKNATLVEPDPIHRGVFVNMNILCRPITAPPNIPDVLEKTGTTNRERVESITGFGTCGEGCHHAIINPLGFAFENFDAMGGLRTTDNGKPVDTAATYAFANGRRISFTNAVELSRQLASSREAHACYTSNVLEFMLGRSLYSGDRLFMLDLADRSLSEQMSIKELLLSVVESNAFRVRTVVNRSQP